MEEITIKCSDPGCGYEWTYKGKKLKMIAEGKRVYLTCPTCRKNVKVVKKGLE